MEPLPGRGCDSFIFLPLRHRLIHCHRTVSEITIDIYLLYRVHNNVLFNVGFHLLALRSYLRNCHQMSIHTAAAVLL
jgi:hypothetical protein